MMFRDDVQRARVCRALLMPLRMEGLFTEDGPTERALDLWQKDGGHLSSGERVMLLVAMGIWTGPDDRPVSFAEVAYRLGGRALGRVAEVLAVLAQPDASECDRWLASVEGAATEGRAVALTLTAGKVDHLLCALDAYRIILEDLSKGNGASGSAEVLREVLALAVELEAVVGQSGLK
jgi:hypothetical protein